tara:strand:+ start:71750 stop:73156 length:1407 start_codon:yes stop_codon:yes gene_type:complete
MKKIVSIVLFSIIGGVFTLVGYKYFFETPQVIIEKQVDSSLTSLPINYRSSVVAGMENTDFTVAAEKTINSVVHVKNTSYKTVRNPRAEFYYGQGSGTKQYSQVGTGSGVVISSDGYIITNNHVIKNAIEIEVTLNNKKNYKAELIGTDAINDIALLKVEAENLPYVTFGDSNSIKIGDWVLAVGNPYNLTSTVTAGIISAKGRDLDGNKGVDSFIQTDAAVNPGNSGGALVNTRGELVGINTAISSRTGSFIGYSFAVPSNIAKKVVEDLMEFGNVQKAMLGVYGGELNNKISKDLKIEYTEGYYITGISSNSGAEKAGLKQNDIIIKLNEVKISTFADLQGFLRTKRPGDIINVTFLRDSKQNNVNVTLTKNEKSTISEIGLELKNLNKSELKKLNTANGVKIIAISNKELLYYGVKSGYVITSINNKKVISVDDVVNMIANKTKGEVLRIEILNLRGEKERYIFR